MEQTRGIVDGVTVEEIKIDESVRLGTERQTQQSLLLKTTNTEDNESLLIHKGKLNESNMRSTITQSRNGTIKVVQEPDQSQAIDLK